MFAALVVGAIALRLAWVLLVPTHPVGDFALYWESAAHLVEHGAFDPAFIYMPGYVLALGAVQALGGGVLAAKLLGAVVGGLGAWPVGGIAHRLFSRRAGLVAAALYAVWPAGIAVSSVIGTDMPTGVLLATAAYQLARWHDRRPWLAAILFGLVSGLAATVRAVAAPLAVLSLLFWLAARVRPSQALLRAAVSGGVAFLVLLPWGLRNQRRYGEFFLTDSHGGHTALVGANPDTDGVYSRSLNLMFWKGTGFKLFEPPHRQSDHAAYQLALSWARFEPAYAGGLVMAKADRLLTNERPLLYWPIYRQGVLGGGTRAWFLLHQRPIEQLVNGFWYALVALTAVGVVAAFSRRRWMALSLLATPLFLTALYATFFSEVRYHLAIAVFLFPFAGAALDSLFSVGGAWSAGRWSWRPFAAGLALLVAIFLGWPSLVKAGAALRERHRWAVAVCGAGAQTRLCTWKPTLPAPGQGRSPLHGVWNGVGLTIVADQPAVSAVTEFELPAGQYRFTATVDATGPSPSTDILRLAVTAGAQTIAAVELSEADPSPSQILDGLVDHRGGNLRLQTIVERRSRVVERRSRVDERRLRVDAAVGPTTVWLGDLQLAPSEGADRKH